MPSKHAGSDKRDRLAASLAAKLPFEEGVGYELSAAFAPAQLRRYLGEWAVEEHTVDGEPWLDRYAAERLGGAELSDAQYLASYEFGERICVKRVSVKGILALEAGPALYEYRLSLALEWSPGSAGELRARPALGYQLSSLDGAVSSVREFGGRGADIVLRSRFEDGDLILEEGGDYKRLRKSR